MSIRASIISALDARLKTIHTATGYDTDLGASVYHWQTETIPEGICPVLIFQDATVTDEPLNLKNTEHRILIEILLKYVVSSVDEVYDGIEDVLTAMSVDDTLGGICRSKPAGNEIVGVEGSPHRIIVTAKVNIEITYVTSKWAA